MRATTHHDRGQQLVDRRKLLAGVAWSVPVIALSSAAPAFAASPTVDATVTATRSSPTSKEYDFNISLATAGEQITSLVIRYSIDQTYSVAAYNTNQSGAAVPSNWTRSGPSGPNNSIMTFTYGLVPIASPSTLQATFQLIRQDNNASRVTIDFIVTTTTRTTPYVADQVVVTFA